MVRPEIVAGTTAALLVAVVSVAGAESALWRQFKSATLAGAEPVLPDFSFAGYDYSESSIPDTSDWTVYNVTNYGAVAGDTGFDDAGIQAAIDAAEAGGGGIVYFPAGQFRVSPNTNLNESIVLQGDNILLKGSGVGTGGTEIFMVNMKVNNGQYIFEVRPSSTSESLLTTVVSNAPRESLEIDVANFAALGVGDRVILRCNSVPYAQAYYAPLVLDPAWTRLDPTTGFTMRELHTVASIDGNRVRFREPLHLPMITNAVPIEVRSYNMITNVGVEDITFRGNWDSYPETFVHHKDAIHDYAWDAIRFDNVENGWLRNCDFTNWNQCVYFDGCAAFTVENISFSGKKGHMSIHTRRCYGMLVKDCVDSAGHHHGPGVGYWGCGTVYLRHQMAGDQRIDSHSGSPYATLMDRITGGHLDGNGGPRESYPHHARHFVAWNFTVSGGPNNYDFWPSSRNGHTFALPILAGLQGKTVTVAPGTVTTNESPGVAVKPASLFEAQLKFRLGPTVETLPASGIGTSNATLRASLVSTGRAETAVSIFWGTGDGGTNDTNWDHRADLGVMAAGPASLAVTGLVSGQTYHYRGYASNAYFDCWASAGVNFTIGSPYTQIEDFETRTLSAINGQGDWGGDTSAPDGFHVVADPANPADAGNQVLQFDQGVDTEVFLNDAALRLTNGTSSTIFFRFMGDSAAQGPADLWVRLTMADVATPSAFADGETDTTFRDDGAGTLFYDASPPIASNLWHNAWMVVDNAADIFDTYIQPDGGLQTQIRDGTPFRNGLATNDLLSLMLKVNNNAGAGSNGDAWFDDIYISHQGDTHLVAPVGPDLDVDGLADDWEIHHFGSPDLVDGSGDQDDDGFSEWDEFRADTDPTNEASRLVLVSFASLTATTAILGWQASSNRTYRILHKEDILDADWSPHDTGILGVAPTCTHTVETDSSTSYYLIQVE